MASEVDIGPGDGSGDDGLAALRRGLGQVRWECNRRCNLFCEHCYIDATPDAPLPTIDREDAEEFLDAVEAFAPFIFQIEGGETLLREDILEVIEYASTKPWKIVLNSNGLLVDEEMWRALDRAGLHQLNVSIDGHRETHDEFRGRDGLYDDVLSNVRLKEALDCDVRLHVNTVVNRRNVDDLAAMAEDLADLPVAQWDLIRYHPMGRGTDELRLEPEELRAVVESVAELRADSGLRIGLDRCFPMYNVVNEFDGPLVSAEMEAVTGGSIITISPEGEVLPGPHLRTVSFGHIFEDPPEEILRRRHEFVEGIDLPDACRDCEEYGRTCKGGSREVALLTRGAHDAMDPGCWKVDQSEFGE